MATHSSILAWRIPCSLMGCRPWGRKELDTTERLSHGSFLQTLQRIIRLVARECQKWTLSWFQQPEVQGQGTCNRGSAGGDEQHSTSRLF